MRIGVIGAGAVGGVLGARFIAAGEEVTLVDEGLHLRTIQQAGLRVIGEDNHELLVHPAKALSKISEAGPQDLVILAVKAYSLPQVAAHLGSVIGKDTVIMPVQNGIPWWYFDKHGGEHEGRRIEAVDPDGFIARHIDSQRVIGAVVYPAAELLALGTVRHVEGHRIPVGELDGVETERVRRVATALEKGGFKSHVLNDIRAEIWLKLIGNLAFNHICALTHTTMAQACRHPLLRELAIRVMEEGQQVAARLGITLRVSIEKRLAGAERVGHHRPSTLQDLKAGRPLELSPMVDAVVELARLAGVCTPHVEILHALMHRLDTALHMERTNSEPSMRWWYSAPSGALEQALSLAIP